MCPYSLGKTVGQIRRFIPAGRHQENNLKNAITLASLAAALVSLPATAAPQIFFGKDAGLGELIALSAHPNADQARNDFVAALAGNATATENFESYTPSTTYVPGMLAVSFGALGTANLDEGFVTNEPAAGRYPISGQQFWEASSNFFTLNFSSAVIGFGFYGVDIGDFLGQMTITLSNGNDFLVNHTLDAVGGSVLYWGILDADNPFTSVTFGNTGAGADWFGFDDFTFAVATANPVPEPSILGLLGLGFVALRLGSSRQPAAA